VACKKGETYLHTPTVAATAHDTAQAYIVYKLAVSYYNYFIASITKSYVHDVFKPEQYLY
jgi:hypothetical protein